MKGARQDLDKIGRLGEILDRKRVVEDGKQTLVVTEGKVEFVGVKFAFPRMGSCVLENCDLEFPGGQITTILGESGVGKSTILDLIQRNFSPTGGTITIDGQNVGDLMDETLRSRVTLVSQDSYIFNSSILDNIRIGKPDASEEEVHDACQKACIHETIMSRPEQYAGVLQDGRGLSGGEKQRLIIARVFLREPDILLLDEATSALDAETESQVMHNIQQAFKGKTIINVSHRLSAMRNSGKIIVLSDGGKVCESGTHDALVRRGGVYASLWEEVRMQNHQPAPKESNHRGTPRQLVWAQ
ncbi:P-loop containing nucleoside triphosphate hydrolase [Rhypophila decipiens]|uniref:P-loop containing nucleoside triphosphate hydrolase n=1 Tax=Rhypophila decipiens TaxID=261697 RepID=A0AAN7B3G5_9PEZI|nr:P-loop containing nucleoside triphosphate hydrolase [Rhypophila decipiens]